MSTDEPAPVDDDRTPADDDLEPRDDALEPADDGSEPHHDGPLDDDALDPEDAALAERLRAEAPHPPPRLRRRVGDRVAAAFARRALRPRAAAFVASGGALLAASVVLALSGPR